MLCRVLALTAVICVASASAFAQKADVKSQVQQILRAYETAFNKKDGAGIAALLTKDAVFVTPTGAVIQGRDKIEQNQAQVMKNFGDYTAKLTLEKVVASGNAGWSIGRTVISHGGKEDHVHWASAYAKEDGKLKISMVTLGADVPPMAPPK
ncbi:MAG TPA: nuclear transport factor 2 family protein [Stellaceae bacterium]|nr:nuclear transport factor 2 family protein [Stellaceae bacterium]